MTGGGEGNDEVNFYLNAIIYKFHEFNLGLFFSKTSFLEVSCLKSNCLYMKTNIQHPL